MSISVWGSEEVFLESFDNMFSNFPHKGEDVLHVDAEAESFQVTEYTDHYRDSKVTSCCCAKSYIELKINRENPYGGFLLKAPVHIYCHPCSTKVVVSAECCQAKNCSSYNLSLVVETLVH